MWHSNYPPCRDVRYYRGADVDCQTHVDVVVRIGHKLRNFIEAELACAIIVFSTPQPRRNLLRILTIENTLLSPQPGTSQVIGGRLTGWNQARARSPSNACHLTMPPTVSLLVASIPAGTLAPNAGLERSSPRPTESTGPVDSGGQRTVGLRGDCAGYRSLKRRSAR